MGAGDRYSQPSGTRNKNGEGTYAFAVNGLSAQVKNLPACARLCG